MESGCAFWDGSKARTVQRLRCCEVKPGCVAHLFEFATRPMKDGNRPYNNAYYCNPCLPLIKHSANV
jgi:hypothetical protein